MTTVLFATNMYPTPAAPYYGIFVRDQAEALRARGLDIELLFIDGRESKFAYARALAQIVRRLRAGGVDLIHCHHTFAALVAIAARRIARSRVPLVFSFHEGEVFNPHPDFAPRNWRALKSFALRRADFVLPVERRMIAAVLGTDSPRIACDVIPAGIDLKLFTPGDADEARENLDWPEDGPILFFPFAPGKHAKRHDLVAAAYAIIRREKPKTRLIVGGSIRHEQMADALRACDVLLMISDYEASPTVVKEAFACERPVVATDVGDIRESYGDLPGARIVAPDPAAIARGVQEAFDCPQPFGGRQRIETLGLDLSRTADRIVGCYRELGVPTPARPKKSQDLI